MGSTAISVRATTVALFALLFISSVHSFYLPGVAPRDFQIGDPLAVKVNKLSSTKTQLPYDYYYLKYCKPVEILNSAENLGEVLRGDRIENSIYTFHMRKEQSCTVACHATLDADSAKNFKEKIDDEYRVNMILDNLPVAVLRQRRDGSQSTTYEHGFRVGFKGKYQGLADGVTDLSTVDWAVFKHTHTSKDDRDRWCNDKAKAKADDFTRLREERDSQVTPGVDASSVASDNDLILQAAGGVNSKGRVYGLSTRGGVYKQSRLSNRLPFGVSQQENDRMRTLILQLQGTVAQQEEKATQQQKKVDKQDSVMLMMHRRMDTMEKLLRRVPVELLDIEDDDETQPPSQDLGDDHDHAGHPPA